MVSSNDAVHRAMLRSGFGMVGPQQGLVALSRAINARPGSLVCLAAIPFIWLRFFSQRHNVAQPFYGIVAEEHAEERPLLVAAVGIQREPEAAAKARAAFPAMSKEYVRTRVKDALRALNVGADVADDTPLAQAGLDSLGEQCTEGFLNTLFAIALPQLAR
jgi:hypothetical protein